MSARTWLSYAFILLLVSFAVCAANAQADSDPVVRVGVVIDGPWDGNDEAAAMFEREILEILEGDFIAEFPPDKRIVADWTIDGIRGALDRLLTDSEVDLVIALGVVASHESATRGPLPKPTIAPAVIDADLQQLPNTNGTSGVKNLSYLAFPHNTENDLRKFQEIVPFKNLVMLVNNYVSVAVPEVGPRALRLAERMGIKASFVRVERSAAEAIAKLPPDVEAVYLAPLLQIPEKEFKALADSLTARKIPSFSMFGRRDVELGILASLNTNTFPRLSRRVAINVQRILLGEEAASLPVAFQVEEQLVINMKTARAMGVYPNWAVLTEAELINDTRDEVDRVVSLESVITDALKINRDLLAQERAVAAGRETVKAARSPLLPQVDLNLLALQIDSDRAEQSYGQTAETTVSGRAVLTQVLYADGAWTGYTAEKHLQEGRESDFRALRLDVAQEAGEAYLNLLRAKTFEDIQEQNLERTRSNLALARVREAIGAANPAEVLRWESQIANNRIDVIAANAQRNLAEIDLNRILYRPAEEPFATEDADIGDPALFLYRGDLIEYLDNPWEFKVLRAFLVRYG
ncbi:MAG: TolC family protein, partial [Candidatus Latescibacterota bacterium]